MKGYALAGGPSSLAAAASPFLGVLQQTAATLESSPLGEVVSSSLSPTSDSSAQRTGATAVLILNEVIFGASSAWNDEDSLFADAVPTRESVVPSGLSNPKIATDSETAAVQQIANGGRKGAGASSKPDVVQNSGSENITTMTAKSGQDRDLSGLVNRVAHEYLAPELWDSPVEASRGADGAEISLSTADDNARLQQVGTLCKRGDLKGPVGSQRHFRWMGTARSYF